MRSFFATTQIIESQKSEWPFREAISRKTEIFEQEFCNFIVQSALCRFVRGINPTNDRKYFFSEYIIIIYAIAFDKSYRVHDTISRLNNLVFIRLYMCAFYLFKYFFSFLYEKLNV